MWISNHFKLFRWINYRAVRIPLAVSSVFAQEHQRQFEKLTNVDSDRMILRYVFDDRISITVLPTSQDRDFQFVFSLRKLFRFNRLGRWNYAC